MMRRPNQYKQGGFPACIHLVIKFNEHALYYEILSQWLEDRDLEWVSEDEKRIAIERDSCWQCIWFPDTPVGSYRLAASSFEALMAAVNNPALLSINTDQ
jgi:hypothetical protein